MSVGLHDCVFSSFSMQTQVVVFEARYSFSAKASRRSFLVSLWHRAVVSLSGEMLHFREKRNDTS